MSSVLEVNNLETSFFTGFGEVRAVRSTSFSLEKGETLGIVGESGSGKSVTAYSIIKLVDKPGKIVGGQIIFDGLDIVKLSDKQIRKIRGKEISMIFQDPMTALNPVFTIEKQMSEVIRKHLKLSKKEASKRVAELLKQVGLPDAVQRMKSYPHQFSGGMRQRVVIANAISCSPKLLIADEPTTALDVTIQAQILDILLKLVKENGMSMILITHDLAVISETCSKTIVMYGGRIMEKGLTRDIFEQPSNPYTLGLLESKPNLDMKGKKLTPIEGSPPDMISLNAGCPFAARCPYCMYVCYDQMPAEYRISDHHYSACWLLDIDAPKVEVFERRMSRQ